MNLVGLGRFKRFSTLMLHLASVKAECSANERLSMTSLQKGKERKGALPSAGICFIAPNSWCSLAFLRYVS